MKGEDRDLGMGRAISRRDFVNGATATSAGLAALAAQETGALAQGIDAAITGADYPPLRHGLRGNHPGSNGVAHAERDGMKLPQGVSTGETYDLVVVGAGLSGVAAAWYYREKAGPSARILVLDNHDDFGGHAKRNEYVVGGKMFLSPGGSSYLVSPHTWPYDATRLIKALGIDIDKPDGTDNPDIYRARGMGNATFFNKESFGADRLVKGSIDRPTPEFMAQAPFAQPLRDEVYRLFSDAKIDYMPGLTVEQKIAKLQSMSYRDYLLNVAKFSPDIIPLANIVWCLSADTVTAWFAFFRYKPGFAGLGVTRPKGSPESPEQEKDDWHFPGGNHSIVRLMVRSLIPGAMPPGDPFQSESLRVNYATLDRPGQATRIRLNSTVIHARHVGAAPHLLEPDSREVEVTYVQDGKGHTVMAKDVIMAGMTNMIPYIVPELPPEQKAALHLSVRAVQAPTSMMLRNWEAFEKLKVVGIRTPLAFWDSIRLQSTRSFGAITPVTDPSQPIMVTMWGGELGSYAYTQELTGGALPRPGTNVREQLRILRRGLYKTDFGTFERHARKLMGSALAGSGFDPARDITAITVNRWGHGYCLGQNALWDDETKTPPFVTGRAKFGHIAIANSDSSGIDNAQTAMDEAARAVRELEPRMYGYYGQI